MRVDRVLARTPRPVPVSRFLSDLVTSEKECPHGDQLARFGSRASSLGLDHALILQLGHGDRIAPVRSPCIKIQQGNVPKFNDRLEAIRRRRPTCASDDSRWGLSVVETSGRIEHVLGTLHRPNLETSRGDEKSPPRRRPTTPTSPSCTARDPTVFFFLLTKIRNFPPDVRQVSRGAAERRSSSPARSRSISVF